MRLFFGLVGLAMLLAFGAMSVVGFRDWRAMGSTPTPVNFTQAVTLTEPPAINWVSISGVTLPCSEPEVSGGSGSQRYRLGRYAGSQVPLIVAREVSLPCSDAPITISGSLQIDEPGRIVDLDFPQLGWGQWPAPHQTTLWQSGGPDNERSLFIVGLGMALVGLFIAGFYLKPQPSYAADLELVEASADMPMPEWTSSSTVLPRGLLRPAFETIYDVTLVLGAFTAFAIFMGSIAFESWPESPGSALFMGALALCFVLFFAVTVRGLWRQRGLYLERHEFLARVMQHDVSLAGQVLTVEHPLTGDALEVRVGVHEPPFLIIDDVVMLVAADAECTHPKAIGIGFTPFGLGVNAQRAALGRLRAWLAHASRVPSGPSA